MLHQGGRRYSASRETLWRFPGAGRVEVLFADGRPFHAFTAGRPAAVHHCGADRYEVAYAFDDRVWSSRWVVRGPAKDYVIHTRHRRMPDGGSEQKCPSRAL